MFGPKRVYFYPPGAVRWPGSPTTARFGPKATRLWGIRFLSEFLLAGTKESNKTHPRLWETHYFWFLRSHTMSARAQCGRYGIPVCFPPTSRTRRTQACKRASAQACTDAPPTDRHAQTVLSTARRVSQRADCGSNPPCAFRKRAVCGGLARH